MKVLEFFTDLQDNNYPYNAGDTYPREGYKPSAKRIDELATDKNVRKHPIIQLDEGEVVPEVIPEVEETEKQPTKKRKKSED